MIVCSGVGVGACCLFIIGNLVMSIRLFCSTCRLLSLKYLFFTICCICSDAFVFGLNGKECHICMTLFCSSLLRRSDLTFWEYGRNSINRILLIFVTSIEVPHMCLGSLAIVLICMVTHWQRYLSITVIARLDCSEALRSVWFFSSLGCWLSLCLICFDSWIIFFSLSNSSGFLCRCQFFQLSVLTILPICYLRASDSGTISITLPPTISTCWLKDRDGWTIFLYIVCQVCWEWIEQWKTIYEAHVFRQL